MFVFKLFNHASFFTSENLNPASMLPNALEYALQNMPLLRILSRCSSNDSNFDGVETHAIQMMPIFEEQEHGYLN